MSKRIRRGDPQRQRYWEEVVRRWRDGGQSVRAFCRAEGLRESAFFFWRREAGAAWPACSQAGYFPAGARGCGRGASCMPGNGGLAVVYAGVAATWLWRPSFLPVQVVESASQRPGVAELPHGVEIVLAPGRTVPRAGRLRSADACGRAGRAGGATVLNLPELVRIYVCLTPTDMRKSFDTLPSWFRDWLGYDPLSGHLFVFRSRRGDRVKLLWWDRDGLTL